jgi:hypothetical protein
MRELRQETEELKQENEKLAELDKKLAELESKIDTVLHSPATNSTPAQSTDNN